MMFLVILCYLLFTEIGELKAFVLIILHLTHLRILLLCRLLCSLWFSAFATWAALMNLSSNKWAKQKLLAAKGGNDTGKLSLYVNLLSTLAVLTKLILIGLGLPTRLVQTAGNPANRLEARCYAFQQMVLLWSLLEL